MGRSEVYIGLFSNEPYEKGRVTGIEDSALNIYGALSNIHWALFSVYIGRCGVCIYGALFK